VVPHEVKKIFRISSIAVTADDSDGSGYGTTARRHWPKPNDGSRADDGGRSIRWDVIKPMTPDEVSKRYRA
jgi:hypothetical protein